jgi:nucleoside-diphosphate-sugar epimerase
VKVLVDGAAGLVGRHGVETLRARSISVRATDRVALPAWPDVERDVRDLETAPLFDLFDGVTHVVHAAGLFDLSAPRAALFRVNVSTLERMARAALLAGVDRFVHLSSVTVYGRPARAPVREDAPHAPGNDYERSKAAGERAVTAVSGLPVVVLRPSGIYGPWSRYGLAAAIALLALARERGGRGHRSLRGGPKMTHVHVEDVAAAAVHLLTRDGVVGRAFNVADGVPIAWGDLMAALERAIGLEEKDPIAMSVAKARWIARANALFPGRGARTNRSLARAWASLCAERDLVPALAPRIDASAYDYWSADHVYAIDSLARAGFAPRHTGVVRSITETIDWYRAQRWLP